MRKHLICRWASRKYNRVARTLLMGFTLFILAGSVFAQQSTAYTSAREKLLKSLKKRAIDQNYTRLTRLRRTLSVTVSVAPVFFAGDKHQPSVRTNHDIIEKITIKYTKNPNGK